MEPELLWTAGDVARKSFLWLRGEWSAERARQLLDVGATHMIVGRGDTDTSYFLLKAEEVTALLERDGSSTLDQALDRAKMKPTPAVDAYTDAEYAPPRCVVVEEGMVVGFLDAEHVAAPKRRKRSVAQHAGDGAAAPSTDLVTRSLQAEFPERVAVGKEVSLTVSLTGAPTTKNAFDIALPEGTQVDVLVRAKRGFEVSGETEASLTLSATSEPEVRFKLKALEVGPGLVEVAAYNGTQRLGSISLAPTVVADTGGREPATPLRRRAREKRLARAAAQSADLAMLVHLRQPDRPREYTIMLHAPTVGLNFREFEPMTLEQDPREFFRAWFADIEELGGETSTIRLDTAERLERKFASLSESVFPTKLRDQLWTLRDKLNSIVVYSDEPHIPWELCRLVGKVGATTKEGPFLCEGYLVTRWRQQTDLIDLPALTNIAVVAPEDSGLDLAEKECEYLLSLRTKDRQVTRIPATFGSVLAALKSGKYDAWHFVGHGSDPSSNPDRSVFELKEKTPLTPEHISGEITNLGKARPLVFLNACQSGGSGKSLTGVGGWADRFVKAGASAFVGTYWEVFDETAAEFSRNFYAHLLAGKSIGGAVQAARLAIKKKDTTWLAYTVFANPLATLQG